MDTERSCQYGVYDARIGHVYGPFDDENTAREWLDTWLRTPGDVYDYTIVTIS